MRGTLGLAVLAAVLSGAPAAAAPGRSVRVLVVDASGAPVAKARVLIAADEMDAVGTTDAAGAVQFTTTSSTVEVRVESGSQKASARSSAATVTVRIGGAR